MASKPTLRRRMIVNLTLMVLGSLAIGGGSMIAVNGLHQDLGVAVQGYWQVRQLFNMGFLAAKAREAISANPPQPQQAIAALESALSALDERSPAAAAKWIDESARDNCRQLLKKSIDEVNRSPQSLPSLNLLFARMSKISDQVRKSIADAQQAADRKQQIAQYIILSLCGIVVIGAIAIGIGQYRCVVGPVRHIGDGVRAFAKGEFNSRIDLIGDREFVALAADFNKMADDLSALYRDLEEKVRKKSKELVRSERLASVGYLAAGVAHEINNPLGIIAGYSERAMQQLSNGANDSTLPNTQKALAVICEETFRCKQIIDRLLSLARPGLEKRQIVSIANIAETVVGTLSGLGTAEGQILTLTVEPIADFSALVNEGEIKQVLLNLIINAMEATTGNKAGSNCQGITPSSDTPGEGRGDGDLKRHTDPTLRTHPHPIPLPEQREREPEVRISISRNNDDIQLSVTDNGQGMTSDTLDKIFQPFFSEKRGQRPGTGLGLAIAQAIITDHGGRIEAHSAGPGTGSTFTVYLPAAIKEPVVATV